MWPQGKLFSAEAAEDGEEEEEDRGEITRLTMSLNLATLTTMQRPRVVFGKGARK